MKTPIWELSPGHLVTWLLNNTEAKPIDLWMITLADGTVLRYAGGDAVVDIAGVGTWLLGPKFRRTRTSQRMGVSVDNMAVQVMATDDNQLNGVPILRAIAQNALQGAEVAVMWCFLNASNAPQGIVGGFGGRVGDVPGANRFAVQFNVRSWAAVLDTMVPGDVFQPGCRNQVFGPRCKLAEASFTVAGTVASATPDRRTITSTSAAVIAKPSSWATLGTLRFTTGPNAGLSRPVRVHSLSGSTATVSAIYPFSFAPAVGNAFELVAGCDKTRAMCASVKFNNLANFRGESFIPPPETAA